MITDRCLKRDEMERYLHGWSDEPASQFAEQHLAECPACEKTIGQLESETNIELPVAADSPDEPGEQETDGKLAATIDSIRNWNGRPPNASVEWRSITRDSVTGDFGNYELFEVIGRGGMAEVYRARHKRLQRDVALKLIRVPRWHMAESLDRIEREIRAVGKLKHPSIVNAVDAGEHEGVQFLVTEFIDGMDVGKIARAIGPMPIADACEIVRVAALGLDHAHANGIVHRDIKPSNLMLDKTGAVKILDFGLVHLDGWTGVSAEVTSVGQLLGTLDYMAPEQADRADNVNHRSDVYSLGATLFRLLCGRAPYAASSNQSPLEKLRLLANERPPSVATLRPDLPAELAALVDRSLDRDPAKRPASAAHLAESLQSFCAGAELSSLLTKAQSQSETGDDSMSGSMNSAAPSIRSLVWGVETGKPIGKISAKSSGRSRYVVRFLIGLAMFSAAVFAGIVLILETQKGQVIIETDSPINVELVSDGVPRKEIELVPGENATRIYAGRYEIRISDGTDKYVIEQNAFVLKRGEKVVAKITVDETAKKADVSWSDNSNAYHFEPNTPADYANPQKWTTTAELERRSVEVYPVTGDVELYSRILGSLLEKESDLRMEADVAGSRLIVNSSGRIHKQIEKLLAELESKSAQTTTMLTEPSYEGKSLATWMNALEFETSGALFRTALNAVKEITNRNDDALLSVRQKIVDELLNDRSEHWTISLVNEIGMSSANFEVLKKHVAESEGQRRIRILEALRYSANRSLTKRDFIQTDRLLVLLKSTVKIDGFLDDSENNGLVRIAVGSTISTLCHFPPSFEQWTSRHRSTYLDWIGFAVDCPALGPNYVIDNCVDTAIKFNVAHSELVKAATQIIGTREFDDPRFRKSMAIIDYFSKQDEELAVGWEMDVLKTIDRSLKLHLADGRFRIFDFDLIDNETFQVNGIQVNTRYKWPQFLQFSNSKSEKLGVRLGSTSELFWIFGGKRPGNIPLELLELYGTLVERIGQENIEIPTGGIREILKAVAGKQDAFQKALIEAANGMTLDNVAVFLQGSDLKASASRYDPNEVRRGNAGGMGGGEASGGNRSAGTAGAGGLPDDSGALQTVAIQVDSSVVLGALIHKVANLILKEPVISQSSADSSETRK